MEKEHWNLLFGGGFVIAIILAQAYFFRALNWITEKTLAFISAFSAIAFAALLMILALVLYAEWRQKQSV